MNLARLWITGTVLVALVALVGACGGGDSVSDETSVTPTPSIADDGGDAEEEEVVDPDTTAAEADDAGAADSETTATGLDEDNGSRDDGIDAGDLPGVLSSNDCLAAASALASAFSGGFTIEGALNADEIEAAFDRMSEVAPSEIKDDLATIADALGEYFSILEDENIDLSDPGTFTDPNVQEAFVRAGEIIDSSEFQEASDNVSRWFEGECEEFAG